LPVGEEGSSSIASLDVALKGAAEPVGGASLDFGTIRRPRSISRPERIVTWAFWVIALVGASALAYRRYHGLESIVPTSPAGIGGDFWEFLDRARQIAAGHPLYDFSALSQGYAYIYTPLVAVALLPFSHASTAHVWHAWTAISIFALVLFGGIVVLSQTSTITSWRRPVLFGFTAITVLEFVPAKTELSNGQTDAFALVFLATAVLASERGRSATSGALIGVSGLIKTWPAAAALSFLRRGYVRRDRAFVAWVLTILLGPLLAAAVNGASGLYDFFRVTFDARSQNLPSYSVGGIPRLLFSHSGLAHPVFVSLPVQYMATLAFAGWVIALIVLTLRWSDSPVVGFWNIVACVVLLLPVSHSFYTLYLLPLLWLWASRALASPIPRRVAPIVAGILGLWWLGVFHEDYAYGSASSLWFSVLFLANLAAVTISVLGDHLHRIRGEMSVPALG
jgi:hypothetical protein